MKIRKAEVGASSPEGPGSSAAQLHTADDSVCVSSITALSPGSNDSVRDVDLSDISRRKSSGIYEGALFEVETANEIASRRNIRGIRGSYLRQLCPFRKCDKKITPIAHLENKHSDPSKGVSATFRGIQLAIAL